MVGVESVRFGRDVSEAGGGGPPASAGDLHRHTKVSPTGVGFCAVRHKWSRRVVPDVGLLRTEGCHTGNGPWGGEIHARMEGHTTSHQSGFSGSA